MSASCYAGVSVAGLGWISLRIGPAKLMTSVERNCVAAPGAFGITPGPIAR